MAQGGDARGPHGATRVNPLQRCGTWPTRSCPRARTRPRSFEGRSTELVCSTAAHPRRPRKPVSARDSADYVLVFTRRYFSPSPLSDGAGLTHTLWCVGAAKHIRSQTWYSICFEDTVGRRPEQARGHLTGNVISPRCPRALGSSSHERHSGLWSLKVTPLLGSAPPRTCTLPRRPRASRFSSASPVVV